MPKVTTVIPLYNKGPHIERTLSSALGQTLQDIEIIVVDDGSSDDGPERVRRFSDPRVRLVTQPNSGPGAARNTGLAMVGSPYVTFLDGDDEQLPEFLHTTAAFLDSHPECATVTSGFYLYPGDRLSSPVWGGYGVNEGIQQLTPDMSAARAHYTQAYMSPCTTLARTSVVRQYGGFYSREHCTYGEDQYLFIKIALNCVFGILMEPQVRIHLEASALACGNRPNRPVFPFLLDPKPIYDVCPPEKRQLLDRMLEYKASLTARHYLQDAEPPDVETARMLLSRYPYTGGGLGARLNTLLWLRLPRLARVVRRVKRAAARS